MAAPVGHIICALALINSGKVNIPDKNAFLAGTSFPDIRYVTPIDRKVTHKFSDARGLSYVLDTDSSFEMGRRFHVFLDREREKYMKAHEAYKFVGSGPLKTQMLKIIEDHILYPRLQGNFLPLVVFSHIYEEEKAYLINENNIKTWHRLLVSYLDSNYWFNSWRYFRTFLLFQKEISWHKDSYDFWEKTKNLGFLIYAYFQVESKSKDKKLRHIIIDFYDNHMPHILENSLFINSS